MWTKPLPNIDLDNRPLYEAYQEHQFKLWRCSKCGEWYFWKSFCPDHENDPYFGDLELRGASGHGTVFATTTTYRAFHPAFEDELPYDYSLIELEEGPLMSSQVVGIPPDEVDGGMAVEVDFRDVPTEQIPPETRDTFPLDGGFTLPYFTPRERVSG